MITTEVKKALKGLGKELSLAVPGFYGKITYNFYNGKFVNLNIEQSIKNDNLKKGAENGNNM